MVITERQKTLALCAGVFVLALAVRAWTNTWLTDFWGDSYHHWLITRLTMARGGVYSDYKGLETVWSPLYHYLSIIPLRLSGRGDIAPLQWMNTLWGSLACALSAYLAWQLYANRVAAFAAGMVLAAMTWHIAFSGMNVAEVFSGVLILSAVLLILAPQADTADQITPWRRFRHGLLFLIALAMPLTRTDLSIYLGIMVVWLVISRSYARVSLILCAVLLAVSGWSAWSFYKTGSFLYWYEQYAQNNLHDWLLLNPATSNAAFAFGAYMNRLSPLVLPALTGGVLSALEHAGARRRNLWLVTALVAGHALFLIIGYTRGIVPLLTERYLALDLPLVAVLVGGWVVLLSDWFAGRAEWMRGRDCIGARSIGIRPAQWIVACLLVALTGVRFWNDIPELEIRRWGIDQEWQVGNFLYSNVQPGDVVLTDAPVAIYRSGKPPEQFVSSVELSKLGDPLEALKRTKVNWIVTQPATYDAASGFVPPALMNAHAAGTVEGLHFDPVWRYDPQKTDIQTQVWHVIDIAENK